ncbi:MAG: MerR family transcriptional regulator [Cyclobacteriaceae bacterium]
MNEKYSISELEKLSGIKAHTIRIWEKRYQLITPQRTPTNIRYYQKDDLTKILRVSILNNNGFKISAIAGFNSNEIEEKVEQVVKVNDTYENHIDKMLLSMVNLNEVEFESELSKLVIKFGFEETIINVIYPLLEKMGILWLTNKVNPAQEHFISHLIRQKVISAIDAVPYNHQYTKTVMMYLPPKELHEIGLLFCYFIAKKSGLKVLYLGQSVPLDDLISIIEVHEPDYLLTSFVNPMSVSSMEKHIDRLSPYIKAKKLFVMGKQAEVKLQNQPENVLKVPNALVFREMVKDA